MADDDTIANIATKISNIVNNGAVSKSITPSTSSTVTYTIPAGYHNGSGKVTVAKVSGDTKHNVYASFSIAVSQPDYEYRACELKIYSDGVQVTSKS